MVCAARQNERSPMVEKDLNRGFTVTVHHLTLKKILSGYYVSLVGEVFCSKYLNICSSNIPEYFPSREKGRNFVKNLFD